MSTAEERIGGYIIHPAATVFPLIEGDEFDGLVDSIIRNGIRHPVVVRGNELIDGRNRLRAVEVAKSQGHSVDVPVIEWVDDGRNVAEWIWDTNAMRRQMTDDGVALAYAAIWPLIAKENEARKEATKFDSEKASKAAKARHAVDTKSCPPQKRDAKKKHADSTVGKVAAKAGVSMHKARQGIEVQKAIAEGSLPADAAKEVIAGKKKLKDVAALVAPRKAARSKASENNRLEYNLQLLMLKVQGAVEKLDANASKKSNRRKAVAQELRRLADRLSPAEVPA